MSNDLIWGNGIEAEFALFRNPSATFDSHEIKYLFFDSKEFIKPYKPYRGYVYYAYKKKLKKEVGIFKYPLEIKKAAEFIKDLEFEKAGKKCLGEIIIGEDENYVYYLIETKTEDYLSRTMESFTKELQQNIKKVLKITTDLKPKYKKEENKVLGTPLLYPYGMSSRILLRNLDTNKYSDGPTINNYTGSYHFTFTLPHIFGEGCEKTSKDHKFFANLIQWIEPLIGSAFHSCDDRSVGNGEKYTKGSYRVAMTGWGNFGGSDIKRIKCLENINVDINNSNQENSTKKLKGIDKRLERETLYKYSYKDPSWRDNLPFKNSDLLEPCRKYMVDGQYSLGGDFRTPYFLEGYLKDVDNIDDIDDVNIENVEQVTYTHGLEIRIFDWFNPKHLDVLGRILLILAEHSRTNQVPMYVYDDKDWNESVRLFMIDGWRAQLSKEYVEKLSKVFKVKINPTSYRAYDIFKTLIDILFEKTKNGEWLNLMSEKKYKTPPVIPKINQKSWEFAFVQHLLENNKDYNKLISFIQDLKTNPKKIKSVYYINNSYNKHFPGNKWKNDKENILEFLKSNKIINLGYNDKGEITEVSKVSNKTLNLPNIFKELFTG